MNELIEKTISLQLPASALFVIAATLGQTYITSNYRLVKEVDLKTADITEETLNDVVSVDIKVRELLTVIGILGRQPEREYTEFNKAVKLQLVQAVQGLLGSADEEDKELGAFLLQQLGVIPKQVDAFIAAMVREGMRLVRA